MNTYYFKAKDLVYIALFVALNAVCAFITVPYVIPFTLQTFGIFFTLLFLGGKKGTITVLLYIVIGILGIPVFSGFNGGFHYIYSPTFGFILGFMATSVIYLVFEIFTDKKILKILACLLGLIACYLLGIIWFLFVYKANVTFLYALSVCVLPFIIPDLVKLFLAILISDRLKK